MATSRFCRVPKRRSILQEAIRWIASCNEDNGSALLPRLFLMPPDLPLPAANRLVITLAGPAFRLLATETAGPQQAPHMSRMIINPGQLFDQQRDARQRPESGLVTLRHGTCQQGFDGLLRLLGGQFGFGAGRPFARQSCPPAFLPSRLPAVSHLPSKDQTACHIRCGTILGKQFARLQAAFFQLRAFDMPTLYLAPNTCHPNMRTQ